ncbi:hypothetical protein HaLaN_12553 [Haematococcus lacustris]|uniref:Uncharacterized protein n=1 Tax=Haematococcus lacustris TaxID=44745 RepID=A0A699Z3P0_HAELA|nr:hypothetical protein HaLaN_12553 [Haematococcus lacustris]
MKQAGKVPHAVCCPDMTSCASAPAPGTASPAQLLASCLSQIRAPAGGRRWIGLLGPGAAWSPQPKTCCGTGALCH